MEPVPSFVDLMQPVAWVMTAPTFNSFITVPTGRIFARRRTITGALLAAGAVKLRPGRAAGTERRRGQPA